MSTLVLAHRFLERLALARELCLPIARRVRYEVVNRMANACWRENGLLGRERGGGGGGVEGGGMEEEVTRGVDRVVGVAHGES